MGTLLSARRPIQILNITNNQPRKYIEARLHPAHRVHDLVIMIQALDPVRTPERR